MKRHLARRVLYPNLIISLLVMIGLLFSGLACNLISAPASEPTPTLGSLATIPPTRTLLPTGQVPTVLPQITPLQPGTPIYIQPTAIVMRPTAVPLFTSTPFPTPIPTSTSLAPVNVNIYSPVDGNVIAGIIQILGNASHPFFVQYQLEFSPAANELWALLPGTISNLQIRNGLLGLWDTRQTPDGFYKLRLRVFTADGGSTVAIVNNLRISNQAPTPIPSNTPIPTSTPIPTATFTVIPTSTLKPTNTPLASVTPAPTNTSTITPTATFTDAIVLLPSETPTGTATLTETPTGTPSETPTESLLPSATATETPTDAPIELPTLTETPTETPTEQPTLTETPTETPTEQPTLTETPTETPTEQPTLTETPTESPTLTETPTETPTEAPTLTETPTEAPTLTETPTETPTLTETPTETPTLEVLPPPERVNNGLVLLYNFAENQGDQVLDSSGYGNLHLRIADPLAVAWQPGALALVAPTSLSYVDGPATVLSDALMTAGEITLEAWIKPSDYNQVGPARIMTLSMDSSNRNFSLGQGLWDGQPNDVFGVRLRTTMTDPNGEPALVSPELVPGPDIPLVSDLVHVVYTRDAFGNARLYLNGLEVNTASIVGDFSTWDNTYTLILGNETSGDRPWLGEYHLVSIYARALTPDEVKQNFDAGADPELPIP